MSKSIIYYLDVHPGAGKTSWAISELANRMQSKETITLYVAPSLKLLRQVKTDLIEEARDTKIKNPDKFIRFIESNPEQGHLSTWVSVSEQLRLALEGGRAYNSEQYENRDKVPLGTTIFLTHEAFLKRQNIDKTNVSVIFDEARKFVTSLEEIKLKDAEEEKWFEKLLKEGSERLFYKDGTPTEFSKVTRAEVPKNLNSKLTSTNSRLQFTAIHAIVQTIKNPDIDLYVSKGGKKWGRTKFRFDQVIIPSNLFRGFKEVILMSAFLQDSQMWHFLRYNTEVILLDLQRTGPYRNAVNKNLYSSSESIEHNFNLITILPLTLQTDLVSLTRYVQGILVPEDAEFMLKMALEKEGFSKNKEVIHLMANRNQISPTKKQKRALAAIDKYGAVLNVFDWYCKTALKVVNNIKRWGKLRGEPLAVANRKYKLDEYLEINYPAFTVIPIQSHGVNDYRTYNCLFFAAAINPDRESSHLYKALLHDYNFAMDHVADACVQCVTRLSIRNPKSTNKVYVIVPDLAMAELLWAKLKRRPSIDSSVANHYKMTTFNYLNPERINKIEKPKRTKDEQRDVIKSTNKNWQEQNRELVRLRTKRNYYRVKLLEDKTNQKYKSKYSELTKGIQFLLAVKGKKVLE